ncbi:ketoacyl-ACP synthase III [Urechidicola sp. KH5]
MLYSIIKGTGAYIPTEKISNDYFLQNDFYERDGSKITKDNLEIISKFQEITTIEERRYITDDLNTSDIAFFASEKAIASAGIDKESLDYIIVAHNFGEITADNRQVDILPSLAARVKHKLGIKNPETVAYDITFGCPGWVQAVIQANYFIKSGDAKRILVIGADVLSRVYDQHDRDGMIYADGAGAVVLEATESETPIGILSHAMRSDTLEFSEMLVMGESYHVNGHNQGERYIKMNGRRLYIYALTTVPKALKSCLEKANIEIDDLKKVLIHQANGKMDEAILERFYKLYGKKAPEDIMPMTVSWLGNSSVATVPTLLDLILNGELEPHTLQKGDITLFASVGAGMNVNAFSYKF